MKKTLLTKIWIGLLCVLIALTGFGLFAFYRFQNMMLAAVSDLKLEQNETLSLRDEDGAVGFVFEVIDKIDQAGGMEQSEKEISQLINTVLQKSVKGLEVSNVSISDETIRVHIEGEGLSMDDYSANLAVSAAGKAALTYLRSNFFEAVGSLFQSQQAMEEQLYGKFAPQFLAALEKEIAREPDQRVSEDWIITNENGEWKFERSQSAG